MPAWAGDTAQGHTLLLWDPPRGARCAEAQRDKFRRTGTRGRTFILPNVLIVAEGESGKGRSRLALRRLVFPCTTLSRSSL